MPDIKPLHILLVALGGMTGSVLRFLAGSFIMHRWYSSFPWGTFTVNVLGSLLIGWVAGLAVKNAGFQSWQLLLATGFCGGFTTFSALSYESLVMIRQQQYVLLSGYLTSSLLSGIVAAAIGFTFSK